MAGSNKKGDAATPPEAGAGAGGAPAESPKNEKKKGRFRAATSQLTKLPGNLTKLPANIKIPNALKRRARKPRHPLIVHIMRARGLPAADTGGTSDPYATINFGPQMRVTKTINKTLDPVWDETYRFSAAYESRKKVVFHIWDKDPFYDDFLGQVTLPLPPKTTTAPLLDWVPLHSRLHHADTDRGEIFVSMHWSLSAADQKEVAAEVEAEEAAAVDVQLFENVESVESRMKMIASLVLPPIIELDVAEAENASVLDVLRCDAKHSFAAAALCSELPLSHSASDLSACPLSKIADACDVPLPGPQDRKPEDVAANVYAGLSSRLAAVSDHTGAGIGVGGMEFDRDEGTDWAIGEETRLKSYITKLSLDTKLKNRSVVLDVMNARGLKAVNKTHPGSDPYVKLHLGTGEKVKSKHVKHTVNPDWNETLTVPLIGNLRGQHINIEVWDHDAVRKNRSLGVATMEVQPYADGRKHVLTLNLSSAKSGKPRGTITFGVTVELPKQLTRIADSGEAGPEAQGFDHGERFSRLTRRMMAQRSGFSLRGTAEWALLEEYADRYGLGRIHLQLVHAFYLVMAAPLALTITPTKVYSELRLLKSELPKAILSRRDKTLLDQITRKARAYAAQKLRDMASSRPYFAPLLQTLDWTPPSRIALFLGLPAPQAADWVISDSSTRAFERLLSDVGGSGMTDLTSEGLAGLCEAAALQMSEDGKALEDASRHLADEANSLYEDDATRDEAVALKATSKRLMDVAHDAVVAHWRGLQRELRGFGMREPLPAMDHLPSVAGAVAQACQVAYDFGAVEEDPRDEMSLFLLPFFVQYIDTTLADRLSTWALEALRRDNWEPMESVQHSESVVDLFRMLLVAVGQMSKVSLFPRAAVTNLVAAVGRAVVAYCEELRDDAIQLLNMDRILLHTGRNELSGMDDDDADVWLSPGMAVRLSNLAAVRTQLSAVRASLEEVCASAVATDEDASEAQDRVVDLPSHDNAGTRAFAAFGGGGGRGGGGSEPGTPLELGVYLSAASEEVLEDAGVAAGRSLRVLGLALLQRLNVRVLRELFKDAIANVDNSTDRSERVTKFCMELYEALSQVQNVENSAARRLLRDAHDMLVTNVERMVMPTWNSIKGVDTCQLRVLFDIIHPDSLKRSFGPDVPVRTMEARNTLLTVIEPFSDLPTEDLIQQFDALTIQASAGVCVSRVKMYSRNDVFRLIQGRNDCPIGFSDKHGSHMEAIRLRNLFRPSTASMQSATSGSDDDVDPLIASWACRSSAQTEGTIFLTTKHILWEANLVAASVPSVTQFVFPLDTITRVKRCDGVYGGTIRIDALDGRRAHFSGLRNGRSEVVKRIAAQCSKLGHTIAVEHPDVKKVLWTLSLTLKNGRNLRAADSNGFSDPYCQIILGPTIRTSKVCTKTLNPDWNQTIKFPVFDDDAVLSITCMDRDIVGHDDDLGRVILPLRQIGCDRVKRTITEKLRSPDGLRDSGPCGTMTIELEQLSASESQPSNTFGKLGDMFGLGGGSHHPPPAPPPMPRASSKPTPPPAPVRQPSLMNRFGRSSSKNKDRMEAVAPAAATGERAYTLCVKIQSATGLLAMDSNGLSDPFVTLKLGSHGRERKTKVVYKSLNPKWQETFEFQVQPSHENDDMGTIYLQCWDKDFLTNDYIGAACIKIGELPKRAKSSLSAASPYGMILLLTDAAGMEGGGGSIIAEVWRKPE